MEQLYKETCPIILVMIIMLIPFANLGFGMFMYFAFTEKPEIKWFKADRIINKIFNIHAK
jgi:hypothetical protein